MVLLVAGGACLVSLLAADLLATLVPNRSPAVAVVSAPGGSVAPLTEGSHLDGFSAWSPDGQRIAFMRDGAIWMMDANAAGLKQILQGEGVWNTTPSWSPDGKQFAFVQVQTSSGNGSIMLADHEGKNPRLVWSAKSPVGYLVWTPDGQHLLFSSPSAITRLEVAGGTAREIYRASEGWDLTAGGIAVSRDGKRLTFGAGQRVDLGIHYDLYSMPMPEGPGQTGQSPTRLTTSGGIMPAYSPTGALIAYRNPRRASGIYLMDELTQKVRRFLSDGENEMYFHPTFSPDGQLLSVSRLRLEGGREDGNSARMVSNLYVIRIDAGN